MIRRAKCERLDRQRRMIAASRDEVAAVDDEEVRHIVRAVELVDDRCAGIVAVDLLGAPGYLGVRRNEIVEV